MSDSRTEKLSTDLTKYKAGLVEAYGKTNGWISSPVTGDGARLDAVADSILNAIKEGIVSPEMAELSFEALIICGTQLFENEHNKKMDFATKESERDQLLAILTHIQNVNRKTPENAKKLKEDLRGTEMNDIWKDVDAIREDNQIKNWTRLKQVLFGLGCAIAIAIIITAMLTPVGWAGVGAVFVGMAVNFFVPYWSQLIGTMILSAVTLGFMKAMRPLDTFASERELSTRTEKMIDTQKRGSAGAIRKFHDVNTDGLEDADDERDDALDDEAPLNPKGASNISSALGQKTAAHSSRGAGSKPVWDTTDTDSDTDSSQSASGVKQATVSQASRTASKQSSTSRPVNQSGNMGGAQFSQPASNPVNMASSWQPTHPDELRRSSPPIGRSVDQSRDTGNTRQREAEPPTSRASRRPVSHESGERFSNRESSKTASQRRHHSPVASGPNKSGVPSPGTKAMAKDFRNQARADEKRRDADQHQEPGGYPYRR